LEEKIQELEGYGHRGEVPDFSRGETSKVPSKKKKNTAVGGRVLKKKKVPRGAILEENTSVQVVIGGVFRETILIKKKFWLRTEESKPERSFTKGFVVRGVARRSAKNRKKKTSESPCKMLGAWFAGWTLKKKTVACKQKVGGGKKKKGRRGSQETWPEKKKSRLQKGPRFAKAIGLQKKTSAKKGRGKEGVRKGVVVRPKRRNVTSPPQGNLWFRGSKGSPQLLFSKGSRPNQKGRGYIERGFQPQQQKGRT